MIICLIMHVGTLTPVFIKCNIMARNKFRRGCSRGKRARAVGLL